MNGVLQPLSLSENDSLADAVYETLLESIVSGQLPSGEILSEVFVAKSLDVSRTPVHVALRQLGKDGLVEQSKNRRARVAEFTRDDIFEIFEMRKFLEGPAAELAAGRMDARHLAPLRARADQLRDDPNAMNWKQQWVMYDEEFHRVIAGCSGNRRLTDDINRYHLLHRGFNKISADLDSLQEKALQEHYTILDALDARDGLAAHTAMVDHIKTWQAYFVSNFPRDKHHRVQ